MAQDQRLAETLTYRALRWSLAAGVLLSFVIVPFVLIGERLELWSAGILQAEGAGAMAALAGLTLLVADVVLPIPASLVLTALGSALGGLAGALVGALGLSLGCCLAYALGRLLGPRRAARLISMAEQDRLTGLLADHGIIALAACRAVPVLAEGSIIAAGILRLPLGRVLLVTSLANVGVSGCYAALGATVTDGVTFAAAFLASIVLPACALLLAGRLLRRHRDSPLAATERSPGSGQVEASCHEG